MSSVSLNNRNSFGGRATQLLCSPHFFTAVILIFLLCGLGLIQDPRALDSGRVPRLTALFAFLATVLLWAFASPLRDKLNWSAIRQPIVYAFSAYLVSVWVSLAFAINPSAGLIDAAKSGATLLVLGLSVVCFRSSENWRLVLVKSGVLAALIAGGIGQFQIYNQGIWGYWGDWHPFFCNISWKGYGLYGNTNLFSAFIGLLLTFGISGIFLLPKFWRFTSFLASFNSIFLIFICSSRSVWLGVLVMLFVLSFFCMLKRATIFQNRCVRWIILVCFFIFILIVCIINLSIDKNKILNYYKFNCFLPNSITTDAGSKSRLLVWKDTLLMAQIHVPNGVGAGNWALRLPEYSIGNTFVEISEDPRTNWIQPHNDYLWIFAEKGLLGISAFLATFLFAWIAGIRTILQAKAPEVAWTALAALGGLTVYMVDSLFSFPLDRVNHQVVLVVLLAALAASDKFPEAFSISKKNNRRALAVWVPASVVILVSGLIISIASLRQEHNVALARAAMKRGHWNTMLLHARFAKTPLRTLDNYAVPVSFLEGFALMKKGKIDEPIKLLEQAQKESPGRYFILNNLGILYSKQGDHAKAVAIFQNLIARYPNRPEARQNLELSLAEKTASEATTPPSSQATEITNGGGLLPTEKIQTTLAELRKRVGKRF